MGTEDESLLDLSIHVIGHDKPAQDANRLLFQWSNASRRTSSYLSLRLESHHEGHSFPRGNDWEATTQGFARSILKDLTSV
jgi:hypothetical protein